MQRSTERFLTTHTGSLLRPDDLVRTMFAKEEGVPVDPFAVAHPPVAWGWNVHLEVPGHDGEHRSERREAHEAATSPGRPRLPRSSTTTG
jgi:hypothetical protein